MSWGVGGMESCIQSLFCPSSAFSCSPMDLLKETYMTNDSISSTGPKVFQSTTHYTRATSMEHLHFLQGGGGGWKLSLSQAVNNNRWTQCKQNSQQMHLVESPVRTEQSSLHFGTLQPHDLVVTTVGSDGLQPVQLRWQSQTPPEAAPGGSIHKVPTPHFGTGYSTWRNKAKTVINFYFNSVSICTNTRMHFLDIYYTFVCHYQNKCLYQCI